MAGMTRSATVVAAYLIRHQKMSCDEAIRFVQSKRPKAFTTKNNPMYVRYTSALINF
jgi:protein-tyrosine phosphatase